MQRATRIFVCVIAVSKSHEFLLKVCRLFKFFSTTTPTPSRQHVVIFSTSAHGIRLRRRLDVFSTTSDTNHHTQLVLNSLWYLQPPEAESLRAFDSALQLLDTCEFVMACNNNSLQSRGFCVLVPNIQLKKSTST